MSYASAKGMPRSYPRRFVMDDRRDRNTTRTQLIPTGYRRVEFISERRDPSGNHITRHYQERTVPTFKLISHLTS